MTCLIAPYTAQLRRSRVGDWKLLRQRSPSTMSFHPSDEGIDDLDVTLLKYVKQYPGICVKELANCMTFYNKDKPAEEIRAKYHTIYYRIRTLENNKFIVTRREPSDKAMERRCFPR